MAGLWHTSYREVTVKRFPLLAQAFSSLHINVLCGTGVRWYITLTHGRRLLNILRGKISTFSWQTKAKVTDVNICSCNDFSNFSHYASKNSDPLHVLLSVKCWQTTCMRYREWDLSLPGKASWPLTTGAQRSAISTMRGSKMDLYFQILEAEMWVQNV